MTSELRRQGFGRFALPGESYIDFVQRMCDEHIQQMFDDEEVIDRMAEEYERSEKDAGWEEAQA